MAKIYESISELTDEERKVIGMYVESSGYFHLLCQCDFRLVFGEDHIYNKIIRENYLRILQNACKNRFQLTENATLYSGHGRSFGLFGSTYFAESNDLVGVKFKYPGFTSTSAEYDVAMQFLNNRRTASPLLCQFELSEGFRLLPIEGSESEYILPPHETFVVKQSSDLEGGGYHLVMYHESDQRLTNDG